jgi:hypothetical protein
MEMLKIATAIFVRKIYTRRVPTIHINHAYPIVMTATHGNVWSVHAANIIKVN